MTTSTTSFINFTRSFNKELNLVGFDLITIKDTYYCEDMYGNQIYIAKTNKMTQVQELFMSVKIANCQTITDIQNEGKKFFKRK